MATHILITEHGTAKSVTHLQVKTHENSVIRNYSGLILKKYY